MKLPGTDPGPVVSFWIIVVMLTLIVSAFVALGNTRATSTLFVGDSLAIGTAPYIHVKHMRVDARTGRPLREGMAMIEKHPRPARLLISLGSNDRPDTLPEVEDSVRYSLLRADCVVWATIHVRNIDYSTINRWLRRRESRRFKVVRWAREVRLHPELLAGDGVHATQHGYYVRSRMYVKEVHKCP